METYDPRQFEKPVSNNIRRFDTQLRKTKVSSGIYWVAAQRAGVYVLCGCPADSVKYLIKTGRIVTIEKNGAVYETGPNAILLSDKLIQNRHFSNLSEFPVLQMLYGQGLIIPNHPNNTGIKPLLIGSKEQVEAQKEYIYRGNYGLISAKEMIKTGLSEELAKQGMRLKRKFAFGDIKKTEELVDSLIIKDTPVEIRNGVFIKRIKPNVFEFQYEEEKVTVDLNLENDEVYLPPYELEYHRIEKEYFAIIHSGEGDGWDQNRPCMGSILMFQGKTYLIDAGPNILATLTALGIDPSEIEGIFHTHAHDDHFAGLPELITTGIRIKYYATPIVRASVTKKLCALMSIKEKKFAQYFDIRDLKYDRWNHINALEVKPILSPHPVETNIFYFRTFWKNGYKTYAHLADIARLEILKEMITDDKEKDGIPQDYYDKIKDDYLEIVDLKKIDIGGGLIHGNAADFIRDTSKKIVLAHKSTQLTKQEKAIGSNATFGATDTLIESNRNYLKIKARKYLSDLFPDVREEKREILLNCPIVLFNPGTVMFKNNSNNEMVYLLLTGIIEYVDSEKGLLKTIKTGSLIGDLDVLKDYNYSGTFRANSYIRALEFTKDLFNFILQKE